MSKTLEAFYESFDLEEFENYKDSLEPLDKIAKENNYEHIEVRHVLDQGRFSNRVLEIIERDGIELVVMGTTGASGLKEIFWGSSAGELLEHAACPVIAIPENGNFDGNIDNIAFTTSFKEEDKTGLKAVLALAEILDAKVHCINVDLGHVERYTRNMSKLKEEFKHNDRLVFKSIRGGDLVKPIVDYLEANEIDMVTMLTHKRGLIEELFNYSTAKQVSYHSNIPVMAYPLATLEE